MVFNSDLIRSKEAKQVNESSFTFLERSSWNRCRMVREIVEGWVSRMKPDAEFLSKLRGKNDKQHAAAMFELIVYALLTKTGYQVQIHPPVQKATAPDFLATLSGTALYLECTLSGNSFESAENERRMAAVEDIVRRIKNYPYFINLGFKKVSQVSVTPKKLRRFIDQLSEASEGIDNEALFHRRYVYQDNGWSIEVSLLRKSSTEIKTSLGYISHDPKFISSDKTIMTALNDKRPSKYGLLNLPYVICICVNDVFFHTEEMCGILFGSDHGAYIDLSQTGNGGFFFHGKPMNTSVSAIFFFKSTDLFTLGNAEWSVWHNPFAKYPLSFNQFPVTEYYFEIEGERLKKKQLENQAGVFELLDIDQVRYATNPKETDES